MTRAWIPRPRTPAWLRSPRVLVGGGIVLLLALLGVLAGALAPQNPLQMNPATPFLPPGSPGFPLGSDEYGRDVLSRVIFGARISLQVATASVAIATVAGVTLGLVAGYYGGWADMAIMRTVDVLLCFPPILLAIAVLGFAGNSLPNLILTIAVLYVPRLVRVVYSTVQTVKHWEFVGAARALGATDPRIIRTAILPNCLAPIFVQTSLLLGSAILLEAGLSFLGLGTAPPTPSWGTMLASARDFMENAPTLVIWPALCVAVVVLGFNLLGDGLRDALDPRLRR